MSERHTTGDDDGQETSHGSTNGTSAPETNGPPEADGSTGRAGDVTEPPDGSDGRTGPDDPATAPVEASLPDGSRRRALMMLGSAGATLLAGCEHQEVNVSEDPPLITDATLPSTGVELDEQVTFSITVDASPTNTEATADNAGINADAEMRRRFGSVGSLSASTNIVELPGSRLRFEYTFDSPNAAVSSLSTDRAAGLGYLIEVTAIFAGRALGSFDGLEHVLGEDAFESNMLNLQTWAFERVDEMAMVAARADDVAPNTTGTDLFHSVRRSAERTCGYYASHLGSMGAHGFDITLVTRTNDASNGWLPLPEERSHYESQRGPLGQAGNRPVPFLTDALDEAATVLNVDFSQFDTAGVVSETDYGNPFYTGDISTSPMTIEVGPVHVRLDSGFLQNFLPVSAHDTPTGRIDAWWDQLSGDAWLHEIAHTLGPGTQVGLLDLYQLPAGNVGDIEEWGLMGFPNAPISSWSRVLGGDIFNPRNWLSKSNTYHLISDTTVEVTPLLFKELGDSVAYVTTAWAEFAVTVQYDNWTNRIPTDATVAPSNVHLRTYILEARNGGISTFYSNANGRVINRSPGTSEGVAIYRFNKFDFSVTHDAERAINGQDPFQANVTPIDLQYMDPSTGNSAEPSLSLDSNLGADYETLEDTDSLLTFEQTSPVPSGRGGGDAAVEIRRNPQTMLGSAAQTVANHVANVAQFIESILRSAIPFRDRVEVPGIDILVENDRGQRAGVDPDTGEIYEEIDGSQVRGSPYRREVQVPGDADVTVTVSSARLREYLRSVDVDVPEQIPYTQEMVLTADPTIDEERSVATAIGDEPVPFIKGRTRQTIDTALGPDPRQTVETPELDLDARPEDAANAELLYVDLTFDRAIDFEGVTLDTVVMESVRPLRDADLRYVQEPVVSAGPPTVVRLVFLREDLYARFGTGEHRVFVSGAFDGTAFYAQGVLVLE